MNGLKERFHNIKDYILYYGSEREEELSGFDMAVVEPSGHSRDGITGLRQRGTIALAYLSAMEMHPDDPDFKILAQCLLKDSNGFVKNEEFGTYIFDMGSKQWNEFLIHKALRLCLKECYDGIFLDTIGDVETGMVPAGLRRIQLIHALNFVSNLRDKLSNHIIIQNNGVEELCMHTSEYIDGICWEGPDLSDTSRDKYNREIIKNLEYLQCEKKVKILLLTENMDKERNIKEILSLSLEKGFLYYNAQQGYTKI